MRTVDTNGYQSWLLSDYIYPSSLAITPLPVQEIEDGGSVDLAFGVTNFGTADTFQFMLQPEDDLRTSVLSITPASAFLNTGQGATVVAHILGTNLVFSAGTNTSYTDVLKATFSGGSPTSAVNQVGIMIPVRHPVSLFGQSVTSTTNASTVTFSAFSSTSYDVTYNGSGVTATNDDFFFSFQGRSGDFDASVQIGAFTGANAAATAALMLRESLDPASPCALVSAGNPLGENAYHAQFRNVQGGAVQPWPSSTVVSGVTVSNAWLRLVRRGATITGYCGNDGTNWTQLGILTNGSPCFGYFGLATWSGTNSGAPVAVSYRNFNVNEQFAPEIIQQPLGITNSLHSNAFLSVDVCSPVSVNYQWFFNGSAIPGENAQVLLLNDLLSTNSGIYWVVASNICGSATSQVATLTIQIPKPLFRQPTISGGLFQVNLDSAADGTFSIETSTNLINWTQAKVIAVTNGTSIFTDALTNESPQRYYRARSVP